MFAHRRRYSYSFILRYMALLMAFLALSIAGIGNIPGCVAVAISSLVIPSVGVASGALSVLKETSGVRATGYLIF